jgi:predicted transcriptional regulator
MSKTNTQPPEDERVLHIRFQRSDEDRVEDTLKALDRGETPEPYFEAVFHEMADLQTVTRPTNLTLLRTVARDQPESIRETARLVDRDVRQVHRNLEELDELGVLDLEPDGQTKRPTVWYDTIEVDLPLTDTDTETPVEA